MPGMDLALLLLAVGLVGVVAAVATGRIRGGLDEPVRGRPDRSLPEGPLTGRDVERLRFNLGARGYRMDEVDEALDRLRAELDDRDTRIAGLTEQVAGAGRQEPTAREPGRETADDRDIASRADAEVGSEPDEGVGLVKGSRSRDAGS